MEWYNSLAKPSWTPAPATISLIWQILYPIIILTFGFVFVQALRGKVPWIVALPFAINLVTNLTFTPILFGMRNRPLAAVDILIVWATILWMMFAVWRYYRWVAVAQVPVFALNDVLELGTPTTRTRRLIVAAVRQSPIPDGSRFGVGSKLRRGRLRLHDCRVDYFAVLVQISTVISKYSAWAGSEYASSNHPRRRLGSPQPRFRRLFALTFRAASLTVYN